MIIDRGSEAPRIENAAWLGDSRVAVAAERAGYSKKPPYDPSDCFPEWPGARISREDNPAYRAVRKCFSELRLDSEHYGTAAWNPLGGMVTPGASVVLKPNWVSHCNLGEEAYGLTDTDCLVTHGSVVRAVLDYACKALEGHGSIVIGDSPIQGTDWGELMRLAGMEEVMNHARAAFPGVRIRCEDFRVGTAAVVRQKVVSRTTNLARLTEYRELDLGADSLLVPIMDGKAAFGVADYPRHRMERAHSPKRNFYLLPNSVLSADVFINLPKMKSHMKAGITCALKNLVGIVGMKDYLPHFRFGSPNFGGDEFPNGSRLWEAHWSLVHGDWERERGLLKAFFIVAAKACRFLLQRVESRTKSDFGVGGGGWSGNDTLWRTILDLNRCLFYFDRSSCEIVDHPQKPIRYLAILDGLIGGHKESPLCPSPVGTGLIMAARNPVALDCAAAAFMGFDLTKIRTLTGAFDAFRFPLAGFCLEEVVIEGLQTLASIRDVHTQKAFRRYEPSRGWKGRVELPA